MICPYGIVFASGMWYAVAHCESSDGVRFFRLDRVEEVELLDARFSRRATSRVEAVVREAGVPGAGRRHAPGPLLAQDRALDRGAGREAAGGGWLAHDGAPAGRHRLGGAPRAAVRARRRGAGAGCGAGGGGAASDGASARDPDDRHFVDVWNPSYASDAMEAHLAVLLGAAKRFDAASSRATRRSTSGGARSARPTAGSSSGTSTGPRDRRRARGRRGAAKCTSTSPTIARSTSATWTRSPGTTSAQRDAAHVPDYYAERGLECDFWYKLIDIRRLVADDTLVVIAELKTLRNTDYNDRPVSLYGGMVDLPLIVTRPDGMRFFDPEVRDELTDERLWAEVDAEAGGVGAMERELRENLFGDEVWMALDPAARTFIATAEKIFRDHRNDPAFDFGPVVGNLAKAVEVSLNAILARVLPDVPARERQAAMDGRTVDLLERLPLTLGQFAHAVGGERALNAALARRLVNGGWFTGELPVIVDGVARVRNPGVHQQRIGREAAMLVRNQLVGVGCAGVFNQLPGCGPVGSSSGLVKIRL